MTLVRKLCVCVWGGGVQLRHLHVWLGKGGGAVREGGCAYCEGVDQAA
jgi:hypothetical protein